VKNLGLYVIEMYFKGLKTIKIGIGHEWAPLIAYRRREMENVKGTCLYEKSAHYLDGYDVYVQNELRIFAVRDMQRRLSPVSTRSNSFLKKAFN